MSPREKPLVFNCEGDELVGIVALPDRPRNLGVLIVVGGPQYRAGSHRQFVHLARALAGAGYSTFRFDYRGMGDSSGAIRTFEDIDADIRAAADAFRASAPDVRRLVIFGLCDAASAALMSIARIERAVGLILANPWVRRPESHDSAVVRHYYADRLRSRTFWVKLLSGRVAFVRAARDAGRTLLRMIRFNRARRSDSARRDFVARMVAGWQGFAGDRLLLLSGRDLTAREFEDLFRADPAWSEIKQTAHAKTCVINDADHTFSTTNHRALAERACIEFVEALAEAE